MKESSKAPPHGDSSNSINFETGTIWTRDNLEIMRRINSKCIDLIYLDPPYNSNANYAAPIGSIAAGAEFTDTWTLKDVDVTWVELIDKKYQRIKNLLLACGSDSMKSYLIYMAVRLIEMKRILKVTGSIFLHCDPTAGHYLKLLLDIILGRENFRNEIVWCYTWAGSPKMRQFNRKHDVIFWYSVGEKWTFNSEDIRIPHKKLNTNRSNRGGGDPLTPELVEKYLRRGKIPESWWTKFSPVARLVRERTGYPTQKPLALLERIIKACSNEGDVVFDPFCGCATTLVAADRLRRRWAGVDVSNKAAELVVQRLKQDQPTLMHNVIHRTDKPHRTDLGKLPPYKSHKGKLYGEQDGYCNGCQEHFKPHHLEVDHIIAKVVGGTDHKENLQLLCSNCNRVKGQRGQEYLITYLQLNQKLLNKSRV